MPYKREDVLNILKRRMDRLPPLPQTRLRLIELADSPDSSAKELVDVIKLDPFISMKVITVVNSSFYNLSKKVTGIQKAVILLGINPVKNLVLATSILTLLKDSEKGDPFVEKIWQHSLWTACLARLISNEIGMPDHKDEVYFLAGIMHDFGAMIFQQIFGKKYSAIFENQEHKLANDLENEAFGVIHTEVAALVAEKWKIPTRLKDCMVLHHKDLNELSNNPVTYLIGLCNLLSSLNDSCFHGPGGREASPLLFGINGDLIAQCMEYLPGEIENAKIFLDS